MNSVQAFKQSFNCNMSDNMPVMIFAVNTLARMEDELNYIRHEFAGIAKVAQLQGCWEGDMEISYAVTGNGQVVASKVIEVAKRHNQKSVLFLGRIDMEGKRDATLFWLNLDQYQHVGTWQEVPAHIAVQQEGWTRNGSSFYIIK